MSANPETQALSIAPLTKEQADILGHVFWIETDSAAEAIEKMIMAMENPVYNCAIWANANSYMSAEKKKQLYVWRESGKMKMHATILNPDCQEPYNNGRREIETLDELRIRFNQEVLRQDMAANEHNPALRWLEDHIDKRLREIFAATAIQKLGLDLRAHESTLPWHNMHTDGGRCLRLLESLASASTLIAAKDDSVYRKLTKQELAARYEKLGTPPNLNTEKWTLTQKKNITLWQIPQDALILLAGESMKEHPILHSEPYEPNGGPLHKRVVLAYDFAV